MKQHFTCTGFIVEGDKTLLLWHERLRAWVPPGGHLEADEDPVAAVLREIREETGLEAEVLSLSQTFPFSYPGQIAPPYTILLEDSSEPGEPHRHIDLIYFCRPANNASLRPPEGALVTWVAEDALHSNQHIDLPACGLSVPVNDDVRMLALAAIRLARDLRG
ncbi:MAG: NUDIX domain-containing protein [Pseudomonas stutzeri]|nr:NUDIX domain-containing protein [Stutzerimonas stutzeri]